MLQSPFTWERRHAAINFTHCFSMLYQASIALSSRSEKRAQKPLTCITSTADVSTVTISVAIESLRYLLQARQIGHPWNFSGISLPDHTSQLWREIDVCPMSVEPRRVRALSDDIVLGWLRYGDGYKRPRHICCIIYYIRAEW